MQFCGIDKSEAAGIEPISQNDFDSLFTEQELESLDSVAVLKMTSIVDPILSSTRILPDRSRSYGFIPFNMFRNFSTSYFFAMFLLSRGMN